MTGADVTEFVGTRDLKLLSDTGILIPHGEKRGRFYLASPYLRRIRNAIKDNNPVPDPYKLVGSKNIGRQPALPGLR
jgi:hypothetical protein